MGTVALFASAQALICSGAWVLDSSGTPMCQGGTVSGMEYPPPIIPELTIDGAGQLLVAVALLLAVVWAFKQAARVFHDGGSHYEDD